MVAIAVICLSIIFISYISGKIINHLFMNTDNVSFISVGFFSLLGLLQFFTYILVSFNLNTKIMFSIYFLVMFLIVLLGLILKIDLKPVKHDYIAIVVGIIISVIGILRIQNYTLGEKYLDSTFYLSMVNENSVKDVYGRMNFYSGKIEGLDYIYDFQSFYALFSMFLKLVRNLGVASHFTTPIYFYSSTFIYLFMFGVSITLIIQKILKNSVFQRLLFLSITSLIFFKYYHYALAFIGNSYRVMGVSLAYLVFNEFLNNKDYKLLLLVGLLFSGLIAVSSSGAFMGLFAFCSILIYFVFKKDMEGFKYGLLGFIPVLSYISLIFLSDSYLYTFVILLILAVYYGLVYRFIDNTYFFTIHKWLIVCSLFALLIGSFFIEKNSMYPYSYFFNDHSAYDMVHDYFSYYHKSVFYPTLSIWILFIIYLFFSKDNFKKCLLIIILFFINPLVTPFIIKFLTNFVFYRAFELVFNLFTLSIFISALSINKYFEKIVCISLMILVLPFSYKQFNNHFSDDMIAKEGYNSYYRISNQELDIFENYYRIVGNNRKIVLSQIPSTKAYLNNIELVFSVFETRNADQYNEVKKDAPSELLNIFFPRDFIGQIVYNTLPNYEIMNDLIIEKHIDYFFIRKDQAILLEDGSYLNLYLKLREVSDIVYENELYVLMESKY